MNSVTGEHHDASLLAILTLTPRHMSKSTKAAVLFFLGSLVLQIGWIMSVPPFRGIDEFDHAFRAAGVAAGQWRVDHIAPEQGRGFLVVAPRSLVEAATETCEWYPYTGRDNCNPVSDAGGGLVTVASGAARYHPVFYWVIGYPATFFDGVSSLYAMRVTASLLCSLMIGLAAWITASWSSTRLPLTAMSIGLTPMVTYSSSLGAPNGIEMSAGLVIWSSLIGISQLRNSAFQRRFIYLSIPAVLIIASVRLLGPLWLALIVFSAIVLFRTKETAAEVLRNHRWPMIAALVVAATSTTASVWWSLSTKLASLDSQENIQASLPLLNSLALMPLWLLQSIGVFPTRHEPAPALVYGSGLALFTALAFFGFRVAREHIRLSIVIVAVVSWLVPLCISTATYSHVGSYWQGRYGLPYTLGLPLLLGLALDQSDFGRRDRKILTATAFIVMAIMQVTSMAGLIWGELDKNPAAATDAPLLVSGLAGLFAVVGTSLWFVGSRVASATNQRPHRESLEESGEKFG